jgi:aryl-alcohol dehydrogenase-like predicted oxidoreductase
MAGQYVTGTQNVRQLGSTDLYIGPLGFGARAAGGADWPGGLGSQDDRDSIAAIRRAVELGMNWIDTAPVYGLGHSEEVVGQAIKGLFRRPYIFTKCGAIWDENRNVQNSLRAESIRREVEGSLSRLGVDAIDLYQIHFPVPDADIEAAWSTLAALQKEGKVRHIGVTNFDVAQLRRIEAIAPVASVQVQYSLVKREVEEEILPYAREHNIGVLAYQPLFSGLLTGKLTRERVASFSENDWRRTDPEFQEPQLTRNLDLVELLRSIAEKRGRTAGEVAIAWVLRDPTITGTIIGGRTPEQVEGTAGAAELRLSEGELAEIGSAINMGNMGMGASHSSTMDEIMRGEMR